MRPRSHRSEILDSSSGKNATLCRFWLSLFDTGRLNLWLVACTLAVVGPCMLAAEAPADNGIDFFETRIRPILVEHCYECHSARSKSLKGGLLLDTRAGLLMGGDSGPAVVPRAANQSLLVEAIRRQSFEMPPKGKLPDEVIADFVQWIEIGAPDPRDEKPRTGTAAETWQDSLARRSRHWCWQPVRNPLATAAGGTLSSHHPVDRFILAKLEEHGLVAAPAADRRTLIRRLKFVLLGIPPTRDEIDAFLNDPASDDQAWAGLVDRFLASPAFGERWARHWMDVVRYAETHGSEKDAAIPKAWRYRDYLIRAFNTDVPYNRFVREHIAGDLPEHARWNDDLGINEAMLGTAWLRMTEFYHSPVDVKNEEVAVIDNLIDTFGKAFQAQTLACARCHNHKFDAISSRDYYALYGIFASSRQGMLIADRPEMFHEYDEHLRELKRKMRPLLARIWREQIASWPEAIGGALRQGDGVVDDPAASLQGEPSQSWLATLKPENPFPPQHALHPLSELVRLGQEGKLSESFSDRWDDVSRRMMSHIQKAEAAPEQRYEVFADLRGGDLSRWYGRGPGFREPRCSAPGDFTVQICGEGSVSAILPAGVYSHLISERHGGSLRSPDFTIQSRFVSALVAGERDSRLRLVIENFQGDAILFAPAMPRLKDYGTPRWVRLPIRSHWLGRRAYLELLGRDDVPYVDFIGKDKPGMDRPSDGRSSSGLVQVVFHDGDVDGPRLPFVWDSAFWNRGANSVDDVVGRFVDGVVASVDTWETGECNDRQTRLLNSLLEAGQLDHGQEGRPELAALLDRYRALEQRIPIARRVSGVMDEGPGQNAAFFPRGNHRSPGAPVRRRYLEVLGSTDETFVTGSGSGRRELAEQIASRENPLTARVMVNRIWHWTFGRGVVSSVDNFGSMGDRPTHPELLDSLAAYFMENGWSVKGTIRLLVTSRDFRARSEASPGAAAADPKNRLLQHANLRRLDAEAIRDAMLATAGTLDRKMFGPAVPVWLAESHVSNRKPKNGPLDGDGRRSIYIEVRRNNPYAFFDVFDRPKPTLTTGRRDVTNVPAQSLTMLNDPFVVQQAEAWAKSLVPSVSDDSPGIIISTMYETAFGRLPSEREIDRARMFLTVQASSYDIPGGNVFDDPRPLIDFAHALLNHKEFIYIR